MGQLKTALDTIDGQLSHPHTRLRSATSAPAPAPDTNPYLSGAFSGSAG